MHKIVCVCVILDLLRLIVSNKNEMKKKKKNETILNLKHNTLVTNTDECENIMQFSCNLFSSLKSFFR